VLESGGCERGYGYGCGCGWEGADGGKWERAFGALTSPPSLSRLFWCFIIEGERVGWGRVEGSEEIDIGAFAFYENAHGGTFFLNPFSIHLGFSHTYLHIQNWHYTNLVRKKDHESYSLLIWLLSGLFFFFLLLPSFDIDLMRFRCGYQFI